MRERLSQLDAALAATKQIQEEAVRVLAEYRARLLPPKQTLTGLPTYAPCRGSEQRAFDHSQFKESHRMGRQKYATAFAARGGCNTWVGWYRLGQEPLHQSARRGIVDPRLSSKPDLDIARVRGLGFDAATVEYLWEHCRRLKALGAKDMLVSPGA